MEENTTNFQQEQVHDLLFGKELGWKDIIYDLINTEQLDPWNVNIIILTDRYLEKINELEETDFFVSSKVLLAAALLLRIKSEILLNKYIKSIDEILFGKKEEKKYEMERIELDEDIPELIPKSPMPRFRKVTLKELMESLNKAIITENRRIKKTIIDRNALRESSISLPKKTVSIKDRIKDIYGRLYSHLSQDEIFKITFSEFVEQKKEERISHFSSLLHLENQSKIWLHQDDHFGEIHIWLKDVYFKNNPHPYAELMEKLDEKIQDEIKEEIKDKLEK